MFQSQARQQHIFIIGNYTSNADTIMEINSAEIKPKEVKPEPSTSTPNIKEKSEDMDVKMAGEPSKSDNSAASKTSDSVSPPTATTPSSSSKIDASGSASSSKPLPSKPPVSSSKPPAKSSKESSQGKSASAKAATPVSSTSAHKSSIQEKEKSKVKKDAIVDNDLIASVRSSSKPVVDKPEKRRVKKKGTKKRKADSGRRSDGSQEDDTEYEAPKKPGPKKGKKKRGEDGTKVRKKTKKSEKLTPAQAAVNDMMRQLLEEDKYSVQGSIVDTDSSDEEEDEHSIYAVSGGAGSSKRGIYSEGEATLISLSRSVITRAARKRLRIEGMRGVMDTTGSRKRANSIVIVEEKEGPMADNLSGDDSSAGRAGRKKKRKKVKRGGRTGDNDDGLLVHHEIPATMDVCPRVDAELLGDDSQGAGMDESSIFGQTTGSSNATWVECDKCKKWRRLRGIVDAKKLPPKWYCTMNRNDPERAKCSAPEEEYEAPVTPETLTDQRARKHLRLWVRRLQCIENYEARLPTMTRGKRRNTTNAKDPYEWVRCCNPSCGKWRSVLRSMDAASVIDAAKNGEWYCVLNTWDEKTASCAAPQENLPAIGCPPWVLQNED